jgi:hypothetical protein
MFLDVRLGGVLHVLDSRAQRTAGPMVLCALATVSLLFISEAASSQCATCGDEEPSSFQVMQNLYNPDTLGIAAGVQAPAVTGLAYGGRRTILVVGAAMPDAMYLTLLERWAARGDAQVAVACPESVGTAAAAAGITVINPVFALAAAVDFHIGRSQGFITYFIDEHGTIVYRHSRYNLRDGAALDGLVGHFAVTGTIPDGTLDEQVLWYGDTAAYPDFALEGMQGEEVWVRPGRPLVVLSCYCADDGQAAIVQASVADLPTEYPEVDFLWIYPYVPWESYDDMWYYGRLAGLDATYEPYALPLDEYLARAEPEFRAQDAYVRECMSSRATWTAALDPSYKLSFYWLLQGTPMITILDSAGVVRFPPTLFAMRGATYEVDPTAVDELRAVLDEIVGR